MLSSFTLNVNGLNTLFKRLRLLDWLNKNSICFLQGIYHKYKEAEKMKGRVRGKCTSYQVKQKKSCVVILVSGTCTLKQFNK